MNKERQIIQTEKKILDKKIKIQKINNDMLKQQNNETQELLGKYKEYIQDFKNRINNYEIHMKSMKDKYSAAFKIKLILENALTKRPKEFMKFFLKNLYFDYQQKKFEEYEKTHPNDESDEYTSDEETKQERILKELQYKKKYEKYKNKEGCIKLSNLLRHKKKYIEIMYNKAKNNYKIPNFDMMARMELDKKKKELEYSGLSKRQKQLEIEKYKEELQNLFKKIYKNEDMLKWNERMKEIEKFEKEHKNYLEADIPLTDITTDVDQ